MTTETSAKHPAIGPALCAGFGTTLAMWIVWWATHLPGAAAPKALAYALLCLTLLLGLIAGARASATPLRTGLLGGLLAALLNLLILGSVLTVQAENTAQMNEAANRFRDEAPTIVLGYLALLAAAGALAGAAGRALRVPRPPLDQGPWLGRFAVIVVLSFFPLLIVGGAVTGTESGMAVPDGVTSYGAFSALLPMSIMAEPRIFLEHTHRLFGTLVGLCAIALLVFALLREKRLAPRIFSAVLLVLVILQGIFGAIRVGASLSSLAAVHGVFAQMVLAFAVVTACKLSPLDRDPPTEFDDRTALAARRAERLTHFSAWALLIQLTFGALARHSENGSHALWTHAGFSIVVVSLVVIAAATLRTASTESPVGRVMRRTGLLLTVTVFAQFVLGFLALWQVGMSGGARPVPTAEELATAHGIDVLEAIITTAHQTLGATLLALVAVGVYWSKRTRKLAQKAHATRLAESPTPAHA
jgi:cytochrome c oxidase assembly protein subunit 15